MKRQITEDQFWNQQLKVIDRFTDKVTAYVDIYNPEPSMQKLAAERTEGVKLQ
jgi:hypothetical protein